MTPEMDRIRVGISACLLGQNVRYDGGHKLDRYLRDTVGPLVEWVPVCPEVECGLPVPREAVRLVGDPASPHLVTVRTGTDLTQQMQEWIQQRLPELEEENLCGFVFKSRSPSSGILDVEIYSPEGVSIGKGAGLFARAFMDHFPQCPVEDDERLRDSELLDNFIGRIFEFHKHLGS